MNHPILLLYNLNDEGPKSTKLKLLSVKQGIKVRPVERREFGKQLGMLAGLSKDDGTIFSGAGFEEEMLVFVGFSNEQLDEFLQSYRAAKIPPIPLKAVLTSTNVFWNSLQLHEELVREHKAVQSAKEK